MYSKYLSCRQVSSRHHPSVTADCHTVVNLISSPTVVITIDEESLPGFL